MVISHQTRDLECFADWCSIPWNLPTIHCPTGDGPQLEMGPRRKYFRSCVADHLKGSTSRLASREVVNNTSIEEGERQGAESGRPHSRRKPTQREQLKAAQAHIVKLKAAIMAIGEQDPAAACLQEALAQLDRSRKKMETFNAEVLRIQEVFAELTTKSLDGVCRLEILKAEARTQPRPFTAPSDPQD